MDYYDTAFSKTPSFGTVAQPWTSAPFPTDWKNPFPSSPGFIGEKFGVAPTKPGFDWGAFGAAAQDLFGGAADVVRAIRGEPVYGNRMAGSRLQEYLRSKSPSGEDSLSQLLGEILAKQSDPLVRPKTEDIAASFSPTLSGFNILEPFNV